MTLLFIAIASFILGTLAAAYPEGLRSWVERWLRLFPSLQERCLQFIDRLLSDLDRRYPVSAR
jgi:hypothetical protein